MVSTRSSTVPPASPATETPGEAQQTSATHVQQPQPPQTSFVPPPAREEQLLNQQLNVQPDINLAALLVQQSQLLQQMQQSLAILAGNFQSLQTPIAQ